MRKLPAVVVALAATLVKDQVTVDRISVPAGGVVTVSGTDCPDYAPVTSLERASLDDTKVELTAGRSDNGFTAKAVIPRKTLRGRHELKAACDAGSAGTTTLKVVDPEDTTWATAEQPVGQSPNRDLTVVAGLLAGVAILLASLQFSRQNRG